MSIDPRLRVLYLAAVAVGAFFVRDARLAAGIAIAHALAWLALGLGPRLLARQIFKLWGFATFIAISYAVTSEDAEIDRWVKLDLGFAKLPINLGGLAIGGMMILRVVTVVLASRIARAGDERAVARGLRKLGAPVIIASSIDAVLALLGGRGGGGGGGGGRGRHRGDEPKGGFIAALRKIARGDVGAIVDRMERQIDRADEYLEEQAYASAEAASRDGAPAPAQVAVSRDAAIIVGISLTMLGIKALKVLPSIPFAPGHKLVLLTPLYVVAALKTRTRLGGTLTGLVMGTVAFLLGDGRYGIFEILKHVAPGVLCDLVVPFATAGGRRPGAFAWSIVGGIMGVGRFATIFTVTLAVQPPKVAWAFLVPGLVVHTTFGILSGLVSAPLINAVIKRNLESENHEQAADG